MYLPYISGTNTITTTCSVIELLFNYSLCKIQFSQETIDTTYFTLHPDTLNIFTFSAYSGTMIPDAAYVPQTNMSFVLANQTTNTFSKTGFIISNASWKSLLEGSLSRSMRLVPLPPTWT